MTNKKSFLLGGWYKHKLWILGKGFFGFPGFGDANVKKALGLYILMNHQFTEVLQNSKVSRWQCH